MLHASVVSHSSERNHAIRHLKIPSTMPSSGVSVMAAIFHMVRHIITPLLVPAYPADGMGSKAPSHSYPESGLDSCPHENMLLHAPKQYRSIWRLVARKKDRDDVSYKSMRREVDRCSNGNQFGWWPSHCRVHLRKELLACYQFKYRHWALQRMVLPLFLQGSSHRTGQWFSTWSSMALDSEQLLDPRCSQSSCWSA